VAGKAAGRLGVHRKGKTSSGPSWAGVGCIGRGHRLAQMNSKENELGWKFLLV
jgi:hypothetical protein